MRYLSSDLFHVLGGDQGFYHNCISDGLLINRIQLNEPHTKWLLLKRKQNVYHGLLKSNRICRLDETSELSMKEIHRHFHQFVHGTRNLWRQGQRLDVLRATNGAHIEVY